MRKVGPHQLAFVFADSPKGDSCAKTLGGPEGKAWLLLIANGKGVLDPTTRAGDTGRLLEQVASAPNLARALLKVAKNLDEVQETVT